MSDAANPAASPVAKKGINLALQGGGAHGAFTWGVLDYLLEDGRLAIEGISGASAGAMNAVMVADGLARGGPEVARTRLADFWRAASIDGDLPVIQRRLIERLFTFVPLEGSPIQAWFDAISHYFSPYDLNPLNINPLKSLIERFVDFDAVRACTQLQLFVSATNVTTGRLRVFPREKITADAVMASACLPLLFKAVTIDGVPYWDGGYLANPPIFPLFHATSTEDVLIVQINPLQRNEVPTSTHDIVNRVNEISFNFLARLGIPRDGIRRPPDRPRPSPARHRTRQVSPHQRPSHRARREPGILFGRHQALDRANCKIGMAR
jgi:NTE family protein